MSRPEFVETWWVVIHKEWHTDEMYGPYLSKELAEFAFEYSMEIDYSCQEDCLDAWVESRKFSIEERRFKGQHKSTYHRSSYLKREVVIVDPGFLLKAMLERIQELEKAS